MQVQSRIVTLLLRLREKHPREVVVLVSHGDVIKAALMYFLGIPLDFLQRLEVSPASFSALVLDEHTAQVTCINDTSRVPVPEGN